MPKVRAHNEALGVIHPSVPHNLFLPYREKQELRHLIFRGDQGGGDDFQDRSGFCWVSFEVLLSFTVLVENDTK